MSNSKTQTNQSIHNEHWVRKYWRPSMAWLYMVICACDFVLFPILHAIVQVSFFHSSELSQWNPITLQGAGLVHLAFGAILGIAAWGRSKEKTLLNNTDETDSDLGR